MSKNKLKKMLVEFSIQEVKRYIKLNEQYGGTTGKLHGPVVDASREAIEDEADGFIENYKGVD